MIFYQFVRPSLWSLTYRIVLIMKLMTIISLITMLQVYGEGYAQTINLKAQHVTLNQVMNTIRAQSGYAFFLNGKSMADTKLSINIKNAKLEEAMDAIVKPLNLEWLKKGTVIVVREREEVMPMGGIEPVQRSVSGKVVDSKGKPIVGTTVSVKGSTVSTTTDQEGSFTIALTASSATLVFTNVGYQKLEQQVQANQQLDIVLQEEISGLDEVVVVGYGTQKKANLTGSVSTVNTKDIQDRAQPNVLTAVQGRVPGVTIISRPGQTPSINFRGRGNLGTSAPLYVIDGVISEAKIFANLDPNSIESVSFLKDASSSSIYGSRAAYGVVLVTTKEGMKNGGDVTVSSNVAIKTPTYIQKLVNSWEYAELYNEAKYNLNPQLGKNQVYSNEEIGWFKDGSKPDLYPNTKWYDLILNKRAIVNQNAVNFSGGTDKHQIYSGLGYLFDQSNFKQNENQRYNFYVNTNSRLNDLISLKTNIKYIQNRGAIDGGTPGFENTLIVPSTFVAKQSNGEWGSVESGKEASATFAGANPLRAYSYGNWSRNSDESALLSATLGIHPLKGLVINNSLSYTRNIYKEKSFIATRPEVPSFLKPGFNIDGTGNFLNSMSVNQNNDQQLLYSATGNYTWQNDDHYFEALAGLTYESYDFDKLGATRDNFPVDNLLDLSAGATTGAGFQNSSSMTNYKMFSYFSRLNYVFKNKYMAEVNFRADASSRFFKNSRWGYFPSFSLGWKMNEEAFMEDLRPIFSTLKWRASYGQLGNINNVGNYDYFQNYGTGSYYSFNNSLVQGIRESKPANIGLGWEKVAISNMGLDFGLWNEKISGSIEYYNKKTSDILLSYTVAFETGIQQAPSQNIASVRNQGVELSLFYRDQFGDFRLEAGGNIATNKNKILKLATSNDIIQNVSGNGVGKYILREGESIGSFFGIKTDGLYTQAEIDSKQYYTYGGIVPNAGDIKFLPNRELAYGESINNEDRVILGNDVPSFTYGLNLNLAYKNFELSAFGQGVNNVKVAFEVYQLHPFFHGQDNPREFHMGRWTEENPNPNAVYPRIYDASSPHTTYNRVFSDKSLFDAGYFRLKTLTLGYVFPKAFCEQVKLKRAKVFFTSENPFTIRKDKVMKDFDPETAGGVIYTFGAKTYAFGINVTF